MDRTYAHTRTSRFLVLGPVCVYSRVTRSFTLKMEMPATEMEMEMFAFLSLTTEYSITHLAVATKYIQLQIYFVCDLS